MINYANNVLDFEKTIRLLKVPIIHSPDSLTGKGKTSSFVAQHIFTL